jgi:hypothetical protein
MNELNATHGLGRSVRGKEAALYGGLVYYSKSGILILFPSFIADSCAHIPAQV